jgi:membrane protein implicated in regulation of membrane protease activity
MKFRLIWAIASVIIEEAAIALIALLVLPQWDIKIPATILAVIMAAWLAMSIFLYITGTRALDRKPVEGPEAIIGNKGRVVKQLTPGGLVKINGELWGAEATDGNIDIGEEVIVISHSGIKLIVERYNAAGTDGRNR